MTLYGLHPEPPAPDEAETSAPRDAELVMVAREVAQANSSAIVAGDLNDVAWSHTSRLFRRISRLLDPRIGRGMFNSFHARYWPLRWPLDHVFVSDDFVLKSMRRLPKFGSDHFPILITLAHTAEAAPLQEAPEDDSEDQAEARRQARGCRGHRGRRPGHRHCAGAKRAAPGGRSPGRLLVQPSQTVLSPAPADPVCSPLVAVLSVFVLCPG